MPSCINIVVRNSDCKVVRMLLSHGIEGSFRNIRVAEKISSHLIHLSKPTNIRSTRMPDVTFYRMGPGVSLG
ncbi:MAG: hypothetical protein N3H84_00635 [Candidatus Caldarchaeum sp.]|nr:hypothetical protein [Candidatus Caldarchaeum sp.]